MANRVGKAACRWGSALIVAGTMAITAYADSDSQELVTLVAAGDVEWSGRWPSASTANSPTLYTNGDKPLIEGGWQPIPQLLYPEKMARLTKEGSPLVASYLTGIEQDYGRPLSMYEVYEKDVKVHEVPLHRNKRESVPVSKIAPIFKNADLAFVNLETPLSDDAYRVGLFKTPTGFAAGLIYAGNRYGVAGQ